MVFLLTEASITLQRIHFSYCIITLTLSPISIYIRSVLKSCENKIFFPDTTSTITGILLSFWFISTNRLQKCFKTTMFSMLP